MDQMQARILFDIDLQVLPQSLPPHLLARHPPPAPLQLQQVLEWVRVQLADPVVPSPRVWALLFLGPQVWRALEGEPLLNPKRPRLEQLGRGALE